MSLTPPSSHGGGAPGAPYKPAFGADAVVLEDSSGDPLIYGGDTSNGAVMQTPTNSFAVIVSDDIGVSFKGGATFQNDVGFYNTSPIAQPVVTDATAPAIITALAALGLIQDAT